MKTWSPTSWQKKNARQQPKYANAAELERALQQLSRLPPLVTSWEIEALRSQLAEAARGERFLLQGGDCSESFEDCEAGAIARKLKILLRMSLVLVHGGHRRVIRVGRFAGQYAKPRSADIETRDGQTLPAYRGDLINRVDFAADAREPDPRRMLRGHERAALTLNFIRSLVSGSFDDLGKPEYWDLGFLQGSPRCRTYQEMVETIVESIRFMQTLDGSPIGGTKRFDFFTSHEALHLAYETAQTRQVPRRTGWYNLGTHLPWLGDRTRDVDGAHVEYFSGIANPIGIKVGPSMTPEELLELLERLDPERVPGRVTLIHRFGAYQIESCLPPLVQAVQKAQRPVLWCSDPMHGNNHTTESGLKTRNFDEILRELDLAFALHKALGSHLGGVHFELTGDNVTECTGGARGLKEADLHHAYRSHVDPRLNYEQALEMALAIAHRMRKTAG